MIDICFSKYDTCGEPTNLVDKGAVYSHQGDFYYGWKKDATYLANFLPSGHDYDHQGFIIFPPDRSSLYCLEKKEFLCGMQNEW